MDGSIRGLLNILITLLVWVTSVRSDHEYMVNEPENVILPIDFETQLTCNMNIEPDKFLWKFYPFSNKDMYNSKAIIDLNTAPYILINPDHVEDRKSFLKVKVQDTQKKVAGDYQCLAYYGASVIASVPSRVTIATLDNFTKVEEKKVDVFPGNTVLWRCELPYYNQDPFVDYFKNDQYLEPTELSSIIKALVIENITYSSTGIYKCGASLPTSQEVPRRMSKESLNLRVTNYMSGKTPYFLATPPSNYTVVKGSSVFLECAAIGNPTPRVFWYKQNGQLPQHRTEMTSGGLKINNITTSDEGVYICNHTNNYGTLSHPITIITHEEPSVECFLNTTDVKQNDRLDLECNIKGKPEPKIAWFLNGYSVRNDSAIETTKNKIVINPVEKRHAGNLQIFASNSVKTVYSSMSLRVIPIATSLDIPTQPSNHRHGGKKPVRKPTKPLKPPKMIPPNKPTVTRLNDQAVVVRWSVGSNTGLPIMFFKVQYRELGPLQHNEHHRNKGSRWKTCNEDIAPHIQSYDVTNLKPDYVYRFRIAAVYSNNDNKLSNNSDKFYLRRMDFDEDNKPPAPLITRTEAINTTAVKIHWQYTPSPNKTIDGFYISFISASLAGDYTRVTVDGDQVKSYVLGYLQPDTVYDIKLQSFNSKAASEYSQTMKAKTKALPSTEPPSVIGPTVASTEGDPGVGNLYVLIAIGVVGGGLLLVVLAVLIGCRRWHRMNSENDRQKPSGEEQHHIQADGNDYVVNPRTLSRTNGCVLPTNRITITPNPLADNENKSQNIIELTCLTSQNNNTSALVSGVEGDSSSAERKVHKNRIRKQKSKEHSTSGENCV
ncbi:interference hedgehog-like isoform X2 [Harmonia axyridis]|uniref:interference hedgehog-like isoform X2 n=1 Tax=Harmonia axyridis TaxID=115357 RepID=UPI001E276D77|nr:interference hedgehog-like isoform X2 [Harmonia axyridis]